MDQQIDQQDSTRTKKSSKKLNQIAAAILSRYFQIVQFSCILIALGYASTMIYFNYTCSQDHLDGSNLPFTYQSIHPILQFISNFSNFNEIYNCNFNAWLQTYILISIILFFFIICFLVAIWILTLQYSYQKRFKRIQDYGVLITAKKILKLQQKNQIRQYLNGFINACIKQKIAQLSSVSQSSSIYPTAVTNLKKWKKVQNQVGLISQLLFLPFNQTKTTKLNNEQVQINHPIQDQTRLLIVIFKHVQIKDFVLKHWQKDKQIRSNFEKDILNIQQAPSPNQIIFQKLRNINEYRNKNVNRSKYILLTIFSQVMYVLVVFGMVCLIQIPQYFISAQFLVEYQFLIKSLLVTFFAMIIFLKNKIIYDNLIAKRLIKSLKSVITRQAQNKNQLYLRIFFSIFNLITPLSAYLLIGFVQYNFQAQKTNQTINQILYGQFGMTPLILYYSILKWIVYPLIIWLIFWLKKCFTLQQQIVKIQNIFFKIRIKQIAYNILQFIILLGYTVFINCSFLILPLFYLIVMIYITSKSKKQLFITNLNLNEILSYISELNHIVSLTFIILVGLSNLLFLIFAFFNQKIQSTLLILYGISTLVLFFLTIILYCIIKSTKNRKESKLMSAFYFISQRIQCIFINEINNIQNQQKQKSISNLNEEKQFLQSQNFENKVLIFTYQEQLLKQPVNYEQKIIAREQMFKRKDSMFSEKNKILQQLNTMSRSLEETLKQRLFKDSKNPFQLTVHEEEEANYDLLYQDKVHMKHKKPKIKIPLLFKPQLGALPKSKKSQSKKNHKQKARKFTKSNYQNQKNIYQQNQKHKSQDSDIEYQRIDKKPNKRYTDIEMKFIEQKNPSFIEQISNQEEQSQSPKLQMKFTELFDSDQESIKYQVRKKIRLSIAKIEFQPKNNQNQ